VPTRVKSRFVQFWFNHIIGDERTKIAKVIGGGEWPDRRDLMTSRPPAPESIDLDEVLLTPLVRRGLVSPDILRCLGRAPAQGAYPDEGGSRMTAA
jgi:hypothetical protein